MTPDISLHAKLDEASRRIRLLLVYHWTMRALCWTALACVLWLLVSKLRLVPAPQAAWLGIGLAAAGLTGAFIGLTRRVTSMEVARITDLRTDAKDRLASAVEFETAAVDDPLFRRQVADAGQHATTLDLRKAYPLKWSWESGGFLALTLVLFLSFWLPTLPMFWSKERLKEMEEVKRAGFEIEKLAVDKQKSIADKKADETKKAAKEAQKLAEAMKKGSLDKKTAMIQLAKLTTKMQEQQRKIAQANTPSPKPMAQAAQEAKKALEQQQKAIEEAAKANKESGKNGQDKKGDKPDPKSGLKPGEKPSETKKPSEAMKQVQQALQKFAQALADQNSEAQNQAMQELAEEMEKGQMSAEEMQQLSQQMQQMANALKGTDLDKVSKQMQEMAKQMQQLKLDPETLKKLAALMRQAGGT